MSACRVSAHGEADALFGVASMLGAGAFAGVVAAVVFAGMGGAACRIAQPSAPEVRYHIGHGCEVRTAEGRWAAAGQPGEARS